MRIVAAAIVDAHTTLRALLLVALRDLSKITALNSQFAQRVSRVTAALFARLLTAQFEVGVVPLLGVRIALLERRA